MKQVELNVSDEFAGVGDLIGSLIADIKAGKSATDIAADALPSLVAAISGYQNFSADYKSVDNQIYLLRAIALGLEPQVVAAPVAAAQDVAVAPHV